MTEDIGQPIITAMLPAEGQCVHAQSLFSPRVTWEESIGKPVSIASVALRIHELEYSWLVSCNLFKSHAKISTIPFFRCSYKTISRVSCVLWTVPEAVPVHFKRDCRAFNPSINLAARPDVKVNTVDRAYLGSAAVSMSSRVSKRTRTVFEIRFHAGTSVDNRQVRLADNLAEINCINLSLDL